MVGIITTPESEIEQKREVKLTNGSGAPTQGTTANGFSEVVAQFVVPSEQRSGVGVNVPVQPVVEVRPSWGNGVIKWTRDTAANDSSKDFTVPANKAWNLLGLQASIDTSADVGNRYLAVRILTSAAAICWTSKGSAAIAASQQGGIRLNNTGGWGDLSADSIIGPDGNAPDVAVILDTIPSPCLLTAGMIVRVLDYAAVAATADDLTVVLHYIEYDV